MSIQRRSQCLLHWEITNKCEVGCKHCYRGKDIPLKDLPYESCLEILSDFRDFLHHNDFIGSIIFSGGDPLLRKDFPDILKIAGEYKKEGVIRQITISGNPECLDESSIQKLKSAGVYIYQLSMDGLEMTHDWFRRPGSFKRTLEALRCLKKSGLRGAVKFTLSRRNAGELIETMRLLIKEEVPSFNFSQLVPVGDGKNISGDVLSPLEYRKVLTQVLEFLDTLPEPKYSDYKSSVFNNESLYSRLFYELHREAEYNKTVNMPQNLTACGKGLVFSVLPGGEVRLRRFIPVKIGLLPRDSFQGIYESSALVKSLENEAYITKKLTEYKKCRDCPTVNSCGNMVADAYYASGDPCGPNPKCWVE
jgi:MoaA/NifB/PqqE/SkfB family radical SAM enzyme